MMQTKYDVICNDQLKFYAQTHCDCGSTLSCGEPMDDVCEAIRVAAESIDEHLRKRGPRCGIEGQQPANFGAKVRQLLGVI